MWQQDAQTGRPILTAPVLTPLPKEHCRCLPCACVAGRCGSSCQLSPRMAAHSWGLCLIPPWQGRHSSRRRLSGIVG